MKIICIIQLFNEEISGNLANFIEHHNQLFDHIIAYDDGSTDNTYSISNENFDLVLRSNQNDFKSEKLHKEILLEHAKKYNPDFIVSLDADEKLITDKDYLYSFLGSLPVSIDALEISVMNLWRSKSYVRLDNLFGDLTQVKIWRYKNEPAFDSDEQKLHQEQFPKYIKSFTNQHNIKIMHLGFDSTDKILEKFYRYRSHGQSHFELLRLIDESNILLKKIEDTEDQITRLSKLDYFNLLYKKSFGRKKITIFALIYQDIGWLSFVYKNIIDTTFHLDIEFYFVANKPTENVIKYLSSQHIPHYIFDDPLFYEGEHYINGVYRAWNFGVSVAEGDLVIMVNSDMAFAGNWVESLFKYIDDKTCITSRLVEQGKLRTGKYGIEKNFGDAPANFQYTEFTQYAKGLMSEELKLGGLYMPLMVRKEHFLKVGGYPDGNVTKDSDIWNPKIAKLNDPCISGDVVLMEKLKKYGIKHMTSFSSIAYHFQEGEMRTKTNTTVSPFNVCVCNDSISGSMGEKVLWNYLTDIDSVFGLDYQKVGGTTSFSFNKWFKDNKSYPDLIIQNATFFPKISNEIFTIAFLQDNLRAMRSSSALQENVLSTSQLLVTNSIITAASYPEYAFTIIPVGVDDILFKPQDKSLLRKKHNFDPIKKIGIFVGSLNKVKGWPEVQSLINQFEEIHWIIITKDNYKNEISNKIANISFFRRIDQALLSEYLNCSDFFIVGSEIETQCLAAIESCLCDIPVVMKKTGIFSQMNDEDLLKVGVIGSDLSLGVKTVINNLGTYSPRNTIKKYRVTIQDCISSWKNLLEEARYQKDRVWKRSGVKNLPSSQASFFIEFFYRKYILKPILRRDSFYSIPEISIFIKNISPVFFHNFLRKIWRKLNKK